MVFLCINICWLCRSLIPHFSGSGFQHLPQGPANNSLFIYVPHQQKGRGDIAFGVDPVGIPVAHCLHLYLLNQSADFDQTCADTLLGGKKEVIRFWWPWPRFQGHSSFFWPKTSRLHPWTKTMDFGQISYIVTLGWFKGLIRFWWPWPNFQGHHTIKDVFLTF